MIVFAWLAMIFSTNICERVGIRILGYSYAASASGYDVLSTLLLAGAVAFLAVASNFCVWISEKIEPSESGLRYRIFCGSKIAYGILLLILTDMSSDAPIFALVYCIALDASMLYFYRKPLSVHAALERLRTPGVQKTEDIKMDEQINSFTDKRADESQSHEDNIVDNVDKVNNVQNLSWAELRAMHTGEKPAPPRVKVKNAVDPKVEAFMAKREQRLAAEEGGLHQNTDLSDAYYDEDFTEQPEKKNPFIAFLRRILAWIVLWVLIWAGAALGILVIDLAMYVTNAVDDFSHVLYILLLIVFGTAGLGIIFFPLCYLSPMVVVLSEQISPSSKGFRYIVVCVLGIVRTVYLITQCEFSFNPELFVRIYYLIYFLICAGCCVSIVSDKNDI